MTVRDLINELECYDDNMEVIMQPCNSMYVDGISRIETNELRAFYGENRDVLVIKSNGQEGTV